MLAVLFGGVHSLLLNVLLLKLLCVKTAPGSLEVTQGIFEVGRIHGDHEVTLEGFTQQFSLRKGISRWTALCCYLLRRESITFRM
jgi:hypothetical protein